MTYFRILTEAITDKLWREVCERAIEDAISGNATARKWISEYLMGRPGMRDTTEDVAGADTGMMTDEILAFVERRLEEAE